MNRPGNPSTFLPDFCGTRTVFVIILLAELLAIILVLGQRAAFDADRLADLALFSLFIQWAALSCLAVLCVVRRYLDTLGDIQVGIISYLITQLTTLAVSELAWWIPFMMTAPWGSAASGHGPFLLHVMGISAIVWALVLRYFYVQYQLRRQIVAEAEARFQALQSRIRPHFLFNCMNTIASLVRYDPDAAEQIVEDLAELFRVTLKEQQPTCPLASEVDLCRRYLRIEQRRLGERLTVDWRLNEFPEAARIPPLTLQPLLENAIYHGIEPLAEGGRIVVRGETAGGRLRIHIDNSLPEDGRRPGRSPGNRIAQENIQQRLEACFGEPGLLRFEQDPHQYHVTVTIPCADEDTRRR